MFFFSGIDGQEDMKLIYGIIVVKEKVKQEKGVKVNVPSICLSDFDSLGLNFAFFLNYMIFILHICDLM